MTRNKFRKEQQRDGKTIILIVAIALLVIVLLVLGLHHMNKEKIKDESQSVSTNISSLDSLPDPVAKINGKDFSLSDFKKTFGLLLYLNGIPDSAESQIPKMGALNQSIIQTILVNKAISEGYSVSLEQTESDFEKAISVNNLTIDGFKEELSGKVFSYDDFLKFYNEQAIISEFLNDTIFKTISISDVDARKYYDDNINQFQTPEQIKASHILVNTSDEADEIIAKLNEGIDFADLAKNYSIGPSGSNGGDLGFFGRGQMVPEFESAAFGLKNIGDYTTTPVKTQFGYHIIKLTDRKPSSTLSFDEVKDKLKEELLVSEQSKLVGEYINKLYGESDVVIYISNDLPKQDASQQLIAQ